MSFFPSMPQDAYAAHLFARYPHIYKLYPMASRANMRGPSPLSYQQRETIGAFVSALNDCEFCFGSHSRTAALFGLKEGLLETLIEGVDTAPVLVEEKPLFHFAKMLTLTPSRIVKSDADAIFEAGWDEDALQSVISVTCTFNFMNRIAPGMGIRTEGLDFDQLGRERHNTEWEAMVPSPALNISDDVDQAMAQAPPNWQAVWGIDEANSSSEKTNASHQVSGFSKRRDNP